MLMSVSTRATLLERLRDGSDAVAWRQFYDRYWRAMYAFARRCGCNDPTAEDVVQDAMATLFERRAAFRYDPARGRFRNWLFTVVRQKLALRRRKDVKAPCSVGGGSQEALEQLPDDGAQPDEEREAIFEKCLLLAMLDAVRQEVRPETYQAFELTAMHGLSAAEAGRLTGLSRNAVYQARRRVFERLRELGASYAEGGELDERVKQALELCPAPRVERTMTARIESTLGSRQELGR